MLSVVLYGRNDSHGYNLHKRAAISFNCMAEVLDDSDDELIFVDYNTPNDLPTFPEAIADTLTDRCRRLLRILRIRPNVHEIFRACTHLVALESVSRNVAIRRANPANRWILSTNTDMVFVPRESVNSLSSVVAGLPDGFYGLPRFDIPQALWESADRCDPQATIAQFRRWGRRFHLNEVVYGNSLIRFDGPGDFQLMTRDDIAAIHGFHEGMIRGWHVDSNLCKRMMLLRGAIGSAEDWVLGYHCDHSRQATLANQSTKIENDPNLYVFNVETPYLPEQGDTWGLPDTPIEEIRLTGRRVARCAVALEQVLEPMTIDRYEADYLPERYNDLTYAPEHALPYIADHLTTLPLDADIGYFGGCARAFTLFRRCVAALGFTGRILIDPFMESWLMPDTDDRVATASADAIAARASALFFEFGLDDIPPFDARMASSLLEGAASEEERRRIIGQQRLLSVGEDGLARLGSVHAAFRGIVRRMRRPDRLAEARTKKFFAINAVNNVFEYSFAEHINLTWPPFTTRLRHGHLRPEWRSVVTHPDWTDLQTFLAAELKRGRAVEFWEVQMLLEDARHVCGQESPEAVEPWRFSEPLAALLRWPFLPARTGLAPGRIAAATLWIAEHRLAARLRPQVTVPRGGADPAKGHALSKLCGTEDWETPDWFSLAEDFVGGNTVLRHSALTNNHFKRSRGVWERVQALWAMECLGALHPGARVAVVTPAVDGLYAYLSLFAWHVDILPVGGARVDESWLSKPRFFARSKLSFHDGVGAVSLDGRVWDAVFLTQNALFAEGPAGAARTLAGLDRHVAVGGGAAASVEVVLNGLSSHPWLSPDAVDAVCEALERHTGWRCAGGFDRSISDNTLDRTARDGTAETRRPHLAVDSDGVLHTVGILALRKEDETPDGGWERFADTLIRL